MSDTATTAPITFIPGTTEQAAPSIIIPGSLKHRLLAKNRKVFKSLDLDGDKVHIIKPTQGDRVKVLDAAKEAGEMGSDDKPTTPRNALRMVARMAACLLYDPDTKAPIYGVADLDDLADAVWLEEIQEDLQSAFAPAMKDVRKNSEATPS